MYLAIQVQANKEYLAIKSIQQRLKAFQEQKVTFHVFEKSVFKLADRQLKEVKEKLLPGYIIAEIKGQLSNALYLILSKGQGVIRVLTDCYLTEDEFIRLKEQTEQVTIQIKEPELPSYRENKVLHRINKALKCKATTMTNKLIIRLKDIMTKIRERQKQYKAYIKNFAVLSPYRRFTGRSYVFEFPKSVLEKVPKRLLPVDFVWDNPTQLALKLATAI